MQIDNMEAKKLIELAQTGDSRAFDELYKLCLAPVYRYIYIRVRDRELSEDLCQTVFIKAYRSLRSYRDLNKPILSFLFTIARNTIIDHSRKQKNQSSDDLEEIQNKPDLKVNIEKQFDGKLTQDLLLKKLDCLTEEQKEAVALKFIEGYSNKEIAEILEKNEPAIRQLQSRGLKILREELKEFKSDI